jgi:hypothetical protein
MDNKLLQGFIAGAIGALVLSFIMYIMQAAGMGEPAFVGMYKGAFGDNPPGGQIVAAIIFIVSGGIWGLVYALIVKHPTILNGFIFGILPTLWLWVVVNTFLGKPIFNGFSAKGLLMPIIFNMVIWGSFIGWYMSRRNTPVAVA